MVQYFNGLLTSCGGGMAGGGELKFGVRVNVEGGLLWGVWLSMSLLGGGPSPSSAINALYSLSILALSTRLKGGG